jgi:hypothetical protein
MNWVFEIFQAGMGLWTPMQVGSEEECQEWHDRYVEMRPDLVPYLNLRDADVDPLPPAPLELEPPA